MTDALSRISKAYDKTVEQFYQGVHPHDELPQAFRNSPEMTIFMQQQCSSSEPSNKEYLAPRTGMRYLDAGCCANLASYRFDLWPSVYYGVDISADLIKAMRCFAESNQISVGGLEVAELSCLPFEDNFFDIATVIGVFEYYTLEYIQRSIKEIHRVTRSGAKIIFDIPNLTHPCVETMFKLEEYLGRPNIRTNRSDFEEMMSPMFTILKSDDSKVMLKYFLKAI